jgi:hypothetical protein
MLGLTRSAAVAAAAIGIALLSPTVSAQTAVPRLVEPPSPGQQFKYVRSTVAANGSGVHRHTVSYTVRFEDTSSAVLTKASNDKDLRGLGTSRIRVDGQTWTAPNGDPQFNFVGLDPRVYCPPPTQVTEGTQWSCDTPGLLHFNPPGHVSMRVTKIAGDQIDIAVEGTASPRRASNVDRDTHREYTSVETARWRDRLTFRKGILVDMLQEYSSRIVIANLTLNSSERTEFKLESAPS